MSENDQEMYESEFRWILNRNSEMATAIEKGLKQGLEQGRKEGALIKAKETAAALKAKGIDVKLIAECTVLPLEQIAEL